MNEDRSEEPVDALPLAEEAAAVLSDRPLAFFNALLTEHFVLQSVRGVTVSESSSRASIYLMTLSSALVAYGFLARTEYALGYLAVVIPVIVLLGVFTYVRLVQTSLEDVAALVAMQRIRRWYGSLLPGAAAYFPLPDGARAPNEMLEIGWRGSWSGVFFTLSSAIAGVNSIVAGAGAALFLAKATSSGTAIGVGIGATLVLVTIHGLYQERQYSRLLKLESNGS
jgi:hypothetical protein